MTVFVFVIASWLLTNAGDSTWPVMRDVHKVFDFPDARTAAVELDLVDEGGRAVYRLECHSWAFGLHQRNPVFDYSGDFECRLSPLYEPTRYSTLLTDDPHPTADWESRARFLVPELMGACADYPEYGRLRMFRLRGMRLTLEVRDVKLRRNNEAAADVPWNLDSFQFL